MLVSFDERKEKVACKKVMKLAVDSFLLQRISMAQPSSKYIFK